MTEEMASAESAEQNETKPCPYCAETIKKAATKCKHCGSALSEAGQSERDAATEASAVPTADYGTFLLGTPLAGILLAVFWVGNMALLDSPMTNLSLIMVGVVLGTAGVAAAEASKSGMRTDRNQGTYSPTAWFFIIALLWIVGYPAYMYKRRRYGLPSRLAGSLVIALIFVAVYFMMASAIEMQMNELRQSLPN